MTYTLTPIPTLDSINDHSGLILIATIMLLLLVIVFINNDAEYKMYKVLAVFSIPVGIAAVISFNTGEYREYANTQVHANLVGFVAEGYSERSGKHRTDHHLTYVEYEVNGNHVMFSAGPGMTYPKIAVLYQN